ncbi:MAG: shikimate dehydrogenase [Gammaproteobacteria bacterium]|nr:shikimate dehydrogenase [Gammaproteobacteria bacterium]
MDTYAVFGNPVAHSKSPSIHSEFARQTGQIMAYHAKLVFLDGFVQAAREFQQAGGKGFNITVPFKEEACAFADVRSEQAERAGAVNTIRFDTEGRAIGDNTDGTGLVRDLTVNHGTRLKGKKILILGAGGAVRGVLGPLLAEKPASLVIANRTLAKAELLADIFRKSKSERFISVSAYTELKGGAFDVIINGTSAGLQGKLPPLPEGMLKKSGLAYDMMYGNEPTSFVLWARAQGAGRALDGLGMLMEQAAEAFYLWRGIRPDTAPVIRIIRNAN